MFYWMAITQNGAEFKGQTENKKKKSGDATTIVLGYGVHFKVIEMMNSSASLLF